MKFVGIDKQSKGYRMSDGQRVIVSREVRFLKKDDRGVWSIDEIEDDEEPTVEEEQAEPEQEVELNESNHDEEESTDDNDFESAEDESDDQSDDEEEPVVPVLRRSQRANKGVPPAYLKDYVAAAEPVCVEPKSYGDALKRADKD